MVEPLPQAAERLQAARSDGDRPESPRPDRPRRCSVCGDPICHAEVDEAGLCGPCGLRRRLRRLPQAGACCALCGERRRRALTLWAPSGEVVCHTCDFYLRERRPWPESVADLAASMARERRTRQR